MATVDGLSKARMLEIEANSVVDGDVVGDNLILTKKDGSTLLAGSVRGPKGDPASSMITPKLVTDLPSTYPTGTTTFTFGAENPGWPAGLGTVFSYIENISRGFQFVSDKTSNKMYFRVVNQDVWGAWQRFGGIDWATDTLTLGRIRLTATNDASAASTLHAFQIGVDTGPNMTIDPNEIMARDNGVGKRVYFEYGINTDSSIFTPSDPGDFVHRKFVDDFRRATIGQRLFSGGGIRKTTAVGISWGQRLMIMGSGRVFGSTNGYWEITMPPDGTVIPMYGSTGGSSVTVAGGVIPLTYWRALYYELPLTGNQVSDPTKFRIMDYNAATTQEIPPNWILICVRNADTLAGNYVWGDGRVQDYWKLLTLTNSWTAYNTVFPAPAWRFTSEGKVETRGLMKGGTAGVTTPFTTLPYPEMAPEGGTNSGPMMPGVTAGIGVARIDILPDGKMCILAYTTGGSNAYVSLDNLSWHPAGH